MELIGQGMEGEVYDLGDDTVRKVWFDRRPDDVRPLKAFLDELPPLPFRTPRIREISVDENGRTVSVEDKLTGVPLSEADVTEEQALDAFVEVVEALQTAQPGPAGKLLPVLNEPFWRSSWGESLAALVARRARASSPHLERDVPGFAGLLERVLDGLKR